MNSWSGAFRALIKRGRWSGLLQEATPGDDKGQQDGPLHVDRQRLVGRQGPPRPGPGVRRRGRHHDTAIPELPRRSVRSIIFSLLEPFSASLLGGTSFVCSKTWAVGSKKRFRPDRLVFQLLTHFELR